MHSYLLQTKDVLKIVKPHHSPAALSQAPPQIFWTKIADGT